MPAGRGSCARTPARRPASRCRSSPDPSARPCAGSSPPEASLANPVDLIATATAEQYRRAIGTLAGWDGIDALIAIFIRPLLTQAEDVAEAVGAALAEMERPIPVQTVFMSPRDHAEADASRRVPTHLYPEDAARALGRVMRHVRWRARPAREPRRAGRRPRATRRPRSSPTPSRPGASGSAMAECARLLDCYGIAMPRLARRRPTRPAPARLPSGSAGGWR